jgi:hypothetical protein
MFDDQPRDRTARTLCIGMLAHSDFGDRNARCENEVLASEYRQAGGRSISHLWRGFNSRLGEKVPDGCHDPLHRASANWSWFRHNSDHTFEREAKTKASQNVR